MVNLRLLFQVIKFTEIKSCFSVDHISAKIFGLFHSYVSSANNRDREFLTQKTERFFHAADFAPIYSIYSMCILSFFIRVYCSII